MSRTIPIQGWIARVHWPPPNSPDRKNSIGWNIERPDSISSTKQAAVIQWLILAAVVLRVSIPLGWVMAVYPRHAEGVALPPRLPAALRLARRQPSGRTRQWPRTRSRPGPPA